MTAEEPVGAQQGDPISTASVVFSPGFIKSDACTTNQHKDQVRLQCARRLFVLVLGLYVGYAIKVFEPIHVGADPVDVGGVRLAV